MGHHYDSVFWVSSSSSVFTSQCLRVPTHTKNRKEKGPTLSNRPDLCGCSESGLTMTSPLTRYQGCFRGTPAFHPYIPHSDQEWGHLPSGGLGLFQRYPISLLVTKCSDRIARKLVLCIVPGSLLLKVNWVTGTGG